ncbi:HTH_Tnp_Tc3_2 domain-containing protein [Trichonephila clavipes]|nr:HTH_Tnp_Tc3_2 domain-containing protein [Trichonephila clavipes]
MKKEKRKTYRCGQRTVRLADYGMQPKPSSLRAQAQLSETQTETCELLRETAERTTELNDDASISVSKRTVQRSFHRMGFGSRRLTKVPLSNASHRAARLTWAKEHRDWIVENWKRVALSDKSQL